MKEFWNNRFAEKEYAYGKEASFFLQEELEKLDPGKILFPGEGEGRNAVFAAQLGWEVFAFDQSEIGRGKALDFAKQSNVSIDYSLQTYQDFQIKTDFYDVIAMVYAHLSAADRPQFHRSLLSCLKPGGILLLEGFSTKQLGNPSGGPQNIDMLYSKEILEKDFQILKSIQFSEVELVLNEGQYHQGIGQLIRMKGIK